jgi:hypothetical protein
MYFFDQLTAAVRDQGLALGKMILATEPTKQQEKATQAFDKIYKVALNLFFLGIVAIFVVYVVLQFADGQPGLVPAIKMVAQRLSFPAQAGVVLGVVALVLLLLRGLLFVFQFVTAADLTKFLLFLELLNLGYQYLSEPTVQPVPFLVEMIKKILKI